MPAPSSPESPASKKGNSSAALEIFGTRVPADQLQDAFRFSSLRLTANEATVMLNLLSKLGFKFGVADAHLLARDRNPERLHCARCHKAYLERENGHSACKIRHKNFFRFEPRQIDTQIYEWHCNSCGEVGIERRGDIMTEGIEWPSGGLCFMGQHTSFPSQVVFDGDNTVTCASKGCFRKTIYDESESESDESIHNIPSSLLELWGQSF